LEGTFQAHLVPPPLPWAGTPSTRPGCSKPLQHGLEHFQGAGSHSFSGQPVPVPHHPHRKYFFLTSNLNLPSISLKLLLLFLSLQALVISFCLS